MSVESLPHDVAQERAWHRLVDCELWVIDAGRALLEAEDELSRATDAEIEARRAYRSAGGSVDAR